ncbi:MAG: aminotransferase class V-fold PLP-dependent enzyme [Coriobacteriales bacterium]|jgi:selenocysteine lyase/cysteine desulfurase|nr:aminotransferase class V-fold PLP-dependent enzyme [Coriobacteriales bacterium]
MSDFIYLNNAATSWPKPPEVARATSAALDQLPGAANRGGIADFDVFAALRQELATLLGVDDPARIALGANATWGLNLAIFGCGLKAGDKVLSTNAEHNSVLRPLHILSSEHGIKLHYLDCDSCGRIPLASWQQALDELHPRLAVFTHASNVTGAVNDVKALTAAAHQAGAIVLLDMAQSLGWLDAIRLADWGVDMAAFTGHKYLLGPQGTGGLYLRPGLELQPHLVGGTGIRSDLDTMPPEMPLHLEAGTGNEPGAWGLLAALRWATEHPLCAQRQRIEAELSWLKQQLTALSPSLHLIDPGSPATPVLSMTIDGLVPDDVGGLLLDSYDIIVRTGLHCAPLIYSSLGVDARLGTVRISLSRFTSHQQLLTLLEALDDVISSEV